MARDLRLHDAGTTRRLETEDLPLALGGPAVPLAEPGPEPSAWIGREGDDLFLQPTGASPVLCNGDPVETSQWLSPGDRIETRGTRIDLVADATTWLLRVERGLEEDATDPPVFEPVLHEEADGNPPPIRPAAFEPSRAGRRTSRRWGRLLAVALLVAVAAGLATLAATHHAVHLEIEPPPDRVRIEGGLLPAVAGTRLLRSGRHVFVAEKKGYRPLEAEIEVGGDGAETFRFELEPLPGELRVEVGGIEGARVLVDGELRGHTPLDPLELEAGTHQVRVAAEGYRERTATVEIEGRGRSQTLALELEPASAPVTFRSEPSSARVRVGGESLGTTPLTAVLAEGTHAVEISREGYTPWTGTARVRAGEPLEMPVARLERSPARLAVRSVPAGAAVVVDGTWKGDTPVTLELSAGTPHELRLTAAGHEGARREVTLEAGERRELSVRLEPLLGEVALEIRPEGARILVGGEEHRLEEGVLRLPATRHEIEVRKEGYRAERLEVTPRPGLRTELRVVLQPKEATPPATPAEGPAALPAHIRTSQGLELVLIEGGRFQLGASRREPGRRSNETLREVELARPFYLAVTETTNEQFRAFREDHRSGTLGRLSLDGGDQPVVNVGWDEAARYCNWLSAREDLPAAYVEREGRMVAVEPMTTGYRLATEAEWARAARYPNREEPLRYPWGSSMPVEEGSGNYADASARDLLSQTIPGYDDGHPVTASVASFEANALGIHDAGGNVAEWVHDVYTIHPPGGAVERDPLGPRQGPLHVIRGSSFMDASISELRLSYRGYGDTPRPDLGFRIARYAE